VKDSESFPSELTRQVLWGIYSSQLILGEKPEEAEKALRDMNNDHSLSMEERTTQYIWLAVNAMVYGLTQQNFHFFVRLLADRNCNNIQYLNAL
jgi:hypothetical protein